MLGLELWPGILILSVLVDGSLRRPCTFPTLGAVLSTVLSLENGNANLVLWCRLCLWEECIVLASVLGVCNFLFDHPVFCLHGLLLGHPVSFPIDHPVSSPFGHHLISH